MGPGQPQTRDGLELGATSDYSAAGPLPLVLGLVSLVRKRITKAGKVKIKLSLLDGTVDKCGICLRQFKEHDMGARSVICRHAFHEGCLRRWFTHSRTCPLCRRDL